MRLEKMSLGEGSVNIVKLATIAHYCAMVFLIYFSYCSNRSKLQLLIKKNIRKLQKLRQKWRLI